MLELSYRVKLVASGVATVNMGNGSAEIFEFDNERARRGNEIDPNNFLSIGAYLEAVRESVGYSINQISEKTHIKPEYLGAIEAMDMVLMPSKPFAIGFVRGYAEALELDPSRIVERFKDEAGFTSTQEKQVEEAVAKAAAVDFERAERPELPLIAVALILAFMFWCGYQLTQPKDINTPYDLSGLPQESSPADGAAIIDPVIAASLTVEKFGPGEVLDAPVVVEAVILERIEPVYPPNCVSAASEVETVSAAFTVAADGAVVNERVAESSNGCFRRAALNALRRWQFSPRRVDGIARPAYEQKVTFRFDRP